jgi:uracil-DNA glycosylase family 4
MDNFWEENFSCPACGNKQLVIAHGSRQSNILIVGEFPGEEELKQSIPMVGAMGRVLRQELAYLKFDLQSARRTNLWRHAPNKNANCLLDGMQEVIKEAKNKQAILLLGDEVVKVFVGKAVTKVTGLNVKSNYFSAPVIVCCSNPAIVFHGKGVGEVRLALSKFMNLVKELGDGMGNKDSSFSDSNSNSSDPWI